MNEPPATQPPPPPPPEGDAAPPWWRSGRFYRRLSLAGVAASLLVHVALWLIAALVHVGFGGADVGGGPGQPVEFAVLTGLELAEPAPTEQTTTPAVEDASAVETSLVDALAELSVSELETNTTEVTDLDVDLGAGEITPSAGSAASSISSQSAGSGSGASFFGLEAQGRRFVYIIDVSSSMNRNVSQSTELAPGATRLAVLKRELSRSIDELIETSEFTVLLFAGDTGRLYPRSWIPATERNRISARSRIARIATDNLGQFGVHADGTDPRRAIDDAVRLRPVPDAIYLMTDGEFGPNDVPDYIAERNARTRIPIHCILFMEPGAGGLDQAEADLRRIARESGGHFAVVSRGRP